ncbi:MAG: hypothetical protein CM15mP22_5610 [Gammaproteobacteria bacterium]|nr:MAG: hypothetical protein CM15mP22_5610 [Gammaproteobacteria bacterium]
MCSDHPARWRNNNSGQKVADIVRELPDGQINFELNDDSSKMQVQSSTGKYNLATQEAGDFPDFDTVPSDNTFNINSDNLISLIQKHLCYGQSRLETLPKWLLNSKNMNELNMVATDAQD